MSVSLYEGDKTVTGGEGIEVTANKVLNLLLRSSNNLIKINGDDEAYVDLQLADGVATTDTLPVGVTTGRVLVADGWVATGTMLCFKTTSGDYVTRIYGDDGRLYIDNGTGTFKQIYLKSEVDALFTQLRGELATVAFSGEYNDLLHKPTLGTAASKDVGTSAGNVPVLDSNGMLDSNIVPSTGVMTSYTVTNKSDLTTLTTAVKGDIGIVTSENKTYILSNDPYSTLSNWTELLFPTGSVSSVNGFTGAVNLTTGYITESGDNLFVSTTEKATWNNKLGTNNVATVALTGNYGDLNNKPVVDSSLNTTSTNAIQNGAVASAVNTINGNITTIQGDITSIGTDKQDTLVSGTNIKTINNQSLLGSGNLNITGIDDIVFVTQTEYDNLPSSKLTDGKTYFIYSGHGSGIVSDDAFGSSWDGVTTIAPSKNAVYDEMVQKQDTLVSGTNIKTINNTSLLGSGNITITGAEGATIGGIVSSGTLHKTTYNSNNQHFDTTYTFTGSGYVMLDLVFCSGNNHQEVDLYINGVCVFQDTEYASTVSKYYVGPFTVGPGDTARFFASGNGDYIHATVYDFY